MIKNYNNNINSHISFNYSIGKNDHVYNYNNNTSNQTKENYLIINNSKSKNNNNKTHNEYLNNNIKNDLKCSTNFSNDYYNGAQMNFNSNNANRVITNNKNMSFIAPALLKNVNSKNENMEKSGKNNHENKFNISNNNLNLKTKNSKNDFDKNNKSKSIAIKLKEKELEGEMLSESFYNNLKKEVTDFIYSKEKVEGKDHMEKGKVFSKEYFKDLKSIFILLNFN